MPLVDVCECLGELLQFCTSLDTLPHLAESHPLHTLEVEEEVHKERTSALLTFLFSAPFMSPKKGALKVSGSHSEPL